MKRSPLKYIIDWYCIGILCVMSLSVCNGQKHYLSTMKDSPIMKQWWDNDSVKYQFSSKEAASLLSFMPGVVASEAGVGYLSQTVEGALVSYRPNGLRDLCFFADGIKHLNSFSFRGNAMYARNLQRDNKSSLTDDVQLFYPFVLADTLSTNFYKEVYSLGADASYRLRNCAFSIGCDYLGSLRYSKRDPRVQNTVSDISSNLSFTYHFPSIGLISLKMMYGAYYQDLSLVNYTKDVAQWVYVMRPLGGHNTRYSNRGDYTRYRHTRDYGQVRLDGFLKSFNLHSYFTIGQSKSRLNFDRAGVYLSEMLSVPMKVYLSADLCRLGSLGVLTFRGKYNHESKSAQERVYNLVSEPGELGVANYQFVASNKSYEAQSNHLKGMLGLRMHFRRSLLKAEMGYYYESFSQNDLLSNQHSFFNIKGLTGVVSFKWKMISDHLWGEIILRGDYSFSSSERYYYDKNITTFIDEEFVKSRMGLSKYIELKHNFYYKFRSQNSAFKIALMSGMGKVALNDKRTARLGCELSYIF